MTPSTLKNARHNLWPRVMFDDSEDAKVFEGCNISCEKTQGAELLRYLKGRDTSEEVLKNLCEDNVDWMHCDSEEPVVCQMTDKEIDSLVMKLTHEDSDESDCDSEVTWERISMDVGIKLANQFIRFLEQKSFITQ